MKRLIEDQIKAEAAERKKATQIKNGAAPVPPISAEPGARGPRKNRESRTQIADAVGMKPTKLAQATKVVETGSDELIDAMDKGGGTSGCRTRTPCAPPVLGAERVRVSRS